MDPDAQRLMDMVALAARPPIETMTPQAARLLHREARRSMQHAPPEVAQIRDLTLGGVPCRFYLGQEAVPGRGLLYLHGGGWMLGDLDSHDGICRALANEAQCRVIAVDYRLAPEHPHPAALEDAAAVWDAIAATPSLGIDPGRLAVGGDSAGGTLAALLSLRVRDRGGLRPCLQALLYPATDLTCSHPSFTQFNGSVPLTGAAMRWFRDHYLQGADPVAASPFFSELGGLPSTFLLTVGYDPLCDEGIAYAHALTAADIPVTHLHLASQVHGFLSMNRLIRAADTVLTMVAAALRHGWGTA